MQLSKVDKFIVYLLVGCFFGFYSAIIFWPEIKSHYSDSIILSIKNMAFILSFVFVVLATFIGIIVESISASWIRPLIWFMVKRFNAFKLFRIDYDLAQYKLWKQWFENAVKGSPKITDSEEVVEQSSREFASYLLHHSATAELNAWVSTNYLTFVLISNFLTLTLIAGPLIIFLRILPVSGLLSFISLLLWIVFICILSGQSIKHHLYSYTLAFQHGYIWANTNRENNSQNQHR
jgi:hypothetical protein